MNYLFWGKKPVLIFKIMTLVPVFIALGLNLNCQ
jgi:hypothetical protein